MKFFNNIVLTMMDVLVFVLCVDKGLTPVTIVGACYIALRLFGRDSQTAIASFDGASASVRKFIEKLVNKIRSMRPADIDG